MKVLRSKKLTRNRVQSCMSAHAKELANQVNGTVENLTNELVFEKHHTNGYHFPIFLGRETFENLMEYTTEQWVEQAKEHVKRVFESLKQLLDEKPAHAGAEAAAHTYEWMDSCAAHVAPGRTEFCSALLKSFHERLEAVRRQTEKAVVEQVGRESKYNYADSEKAIMESYHKHLKTLEGGEWKLPRLFSPQAYGSEDQELMKRVLAAAKAWWDFAHNSVLTNIKGIMHEVPEKLEMWLNKLSDDPQLTELATMEDPARSEKRRFLIKEKERLARIQASLDKLSF